MRSLLLPCLLLIAPVAAHAQSATTFQLPPDPDATSRPQAQGPVDLEGNTRTAPRVITTPTPRPSSSPTAQPSPRATATPTPRPTTQPTRSAETGQNVPSTNRSVPTRSVLANEPATATESASEPVTQPTPDTAVDEPTLGDEAPQAFPTTIPHVDRAPSAEPAQAPELAPAFGFDWRWAAALLGGLLVLGAILFAVMRRRVRGSAKRAELLDVPAASLPADEDRGSLAVPGRGSLEVEALAVTLSRSVMNATISYRVSLYNRGGEPISGLKICGDVTTAHGGVPPEQQLADAAQAFPELHVLDRLDPGQNATLRGELRLPLREVRALRQGNVPVFVPLLRLIVLADNLEPRAHTYVIGAKPEVKGARPNPFRLDEPPRSYAQLSTRAVA